MDVHKHIDDVLQDKYGLDPWVQSRLLERLFPKVDEQKEIKIKLATRLQKKKDYLASMAMKERQAAQRQQIRLTRSDFVVKNT